MDKSASPSSSKKCDEGVSSDAGEMPIQDDGIPNQQGSHQEESPAIDQSLNGISTESPERLLSYGRDPNNIQTQHTYPLHEQAIYYSGFGGTSGTWEGIPYYSSEDGIPISTVIYNDKAPSLLYHPAYGYTSDFVCGQYSPVATPMPSMMLEGQPLYPHQFSSSEGTRYFVPFASYLGNNEPNPNAPSSLTTSGAHPMGILGPYEPSSVEYGYPSYFGHVGTSYQGARHDSGGEFRRKPLQDSLFPSYFDRNRGPRSSQMKPKGNNNGEAHANLPLHMYNRSDFKTEHNQARFFIIKSFSEDNVHRSIKYNVWSSTPHGNKKLDAAYRETTPVFLFFSVNASGQFCGVAEMAGAVDFERNSEHWQQDRWTGQFPVTWHIIKDVPNNRFRHLILESNDNKPVTHSRDSQEVNFVQGSEMLKIFKEYEARTTILNDFAFYDGRERHMRERKARQTDEMSDAFAQSLRIDDEMRDKANHTVEGKGQF